MSSRRLAESADPSFKGKFGCKLSPLIKEGKIKHIVGLEKIAEIPGVLSINPSYREGDTARGYGTLKTDRMPFLPVSR